MIKQMDKLMVKLTKQKRRLKPIDLQTEKKLTEQVPPKSRESLGIIF